MHGVRFLSLQKLVIFDCLLQNYWFWRLLVFKTDVLPKTYVLFIVLTVFLGPRPGALPLGEHINV